MSESDDELLDILAWEELPETSWDTSMGLDDFDLNLGIAQREPRVLWERKNPLVHYNSTEFQRHFRFTKDNMLKVVDLFQEELSFKNKRGNPFTPLQQVLD